jgi:hypothetical protein
MRIALLPLTWFGVFGVCWFFEETAMCLFPDFQVSYPEGGVLSCGKAFE